MTATLSTKKLGQLTLINYLLVIESFIFEILFYGKVPNLIEFLGSVLILYGIYLNVIKK